MVLCMAEQCLPKCPQQLSSEFNSARNAIGITMVLKLLFALVLYLENYCSEMHICTSQLCLAIYYV